VTIEERLQVNLVEYFDEDEYVITACLFEVDAADTAMGCSRHRRTATTYVPVIVDRFENRLACARSSSARASRWTASSVASSTRSSASSRRHVRLMAMIMDYADQAVYSDIWVKDLIGELSWGGGAYIELGPQGAIGRVPPAVSSLNVQHDLDRLVDSIHLGGRWPKSPPRPGRPVHRFSRSSSRPLPA
jgi:hypothetical protein